MISGIGVDMAEVGRIREAFERFGTRFRRRVFTESEVAFCETLPDKNPAYAARFAAKEAFSKALGVGLRGYAPRGGGAISWCEIQVNDNERSRPTITVAGRARDLLGSRRVHLSLSHTREHAVAMVVIESAGAD